jgi:uncharacterized membrane protein
MSDMALIGRLHPMLVHFPIGLVLIAAVAEIVAMATDRREWRTVALTNVRAGAAFSIGAAVAGWRLASSPGMEATSSLEWHQWLGTIAAVAVFGAALATAGADARSPFGQWVYRTLLFWAAALVAVTGHLGGLLVWGADFLRP